MSIAWTSVDFQRFAGTFTFLAFPGTMGFFTDFVNLLLFSVSPWRPEYAVYDPCALPPLWSPVHTVLVGVPGRPLFSMATVIPPSVLKISFLKETSPLPQISQKTAFLFVAPIFQTAELSCRECRWEVFLSEIDHGDSETIRPYCSLFHWATDFPHVRFLKDFSRDSRRIPPLPPLFRVTVPVVSSSADPPPPLLGGLGSSPRVRFDLA